MAETNPETILGRGIGLCAGFVPNTLPRAYCELWLFAGRVYMIVPREGNDPPEVHALGEAWEALRKLQAD